MPRPKKKERKQRSDGRYEYKITLGKTVNGSQNRVSFYSSKSWEDAKKQAEEAKQEFEIKNRTGEGFIDKTITFEEWAKKWLEVYKKNDVRKTTYDDTYVRIVDTYIIPQIGKLPLNEIQPVHIKKMYTSLAEKYYESTLKKVRMCVNAIFTAAIDNRICVWNPAKGLTYAVKNVNLKRQVYTSEQYDVIIEYAKHHRYGVSVLIPIVMGLRRSEVVGLQYGDINFKNNTMHIQRGVTELKGIVYIDEPKNYSSKRLIPVPEWFIKVLKEESTKTIDTNGRKHTTQSTPEDYVIQSLNGKMLSPHNYHNRRYKIVMTELQNELLKESYDDETKKVFPLLCAYSEKMKKENLDFPSLSPHECRHTCGTLLYNKTGNIYAVSKFLGHSNIDTTIGIYIHDDVETLRKDLHNAMF